MNLKTTFSIVCVLGALLPLSQFAPWIVENGLDIPLFFQELFSTNIGGFFSMGVIVSAVVLLLFIFAESKRLNMQNLWLPVVATLLTWTPTLEQCFKVGVLATHLKKSKYQKFKNYFYFDKKYNQFRVVIQYLSKLTN